MSVKIDLLKEFNAALVQRIHQTYPVSNDDFKLGEPKSLSIFTSTMTVIGKDGQTHELSIDYMRNLGQDHFHIEVDGKFTKAAAVTFLPWSPRRFTDSKSLQEKAAQRIFDALDASLPAPKAAA